LPAATGVLPVRRSAPRPGSRVAGDRRDVRPGAFRACGELVAGGSAGGMMAVCCP
jgi:hypothetical protein